MRFRRRATLIDDEGRPVECQLADLAGWEQTRRFQGEDGAGGMAEDVGRSSRLVDHGFERDNAFSEMDLDTGLQARWYPDPFLQVHNQIAT